LIIENITGPTARLSRKPSVIPLRTASTIMRKYEVRTTKYGKTC